MTETLSISTTRHVITVQKDHLFTIARCPCGWHASEVTSKAARGKLRKKIQQHYERVRRPGGWVTP